MSKLPTTRRDVLRTTAVGTVIGSGGFSAGATAQTSSPSTVLWESDFESYSQGEVPSNFVLAGNNDQLVTDSESQEGTQSYEMNGSYGGCWEALMRRELFDGDDRPNDMRIEGSFYLEDGELGCHDGGGAIQWWTVASGSWPDGSGGGILSFHTDGNVKSAGENITSYTEQEWIDFTVEYSWDQDTDEVTHTCTVGDTEAVTVTRQPKDYEEDLTALELQSGDNTVYWDNLRVVSIDSSGEADLSIESVSTNEPIEAGDQLTVDVEITNTGDIEGNQTVELESFNGEIVDTTEVSVQVDQTESTTLIWETETDDAGTGDISIYLDDRQESRNVKITNKQADINVGLSVPDTADPDSSISISGTVENTGEAIFEDTVALSVDDETIDTVESVSASESVTLTGTVNTGEDGTTHEVTIAAGEETSQTAEISVDGTSQISVSIDDAPETAEPDSTVSVSGTAENTGTAAYEDSISLSVDGDTLDTAGSLSAGESVTLSDTFTTDGDGTTHEVEIATNEGSSQTAEISVEQPQSARCTGTPTMSVTSISTPQSAITSDDPAVVEANFRTDPTIPEDCTVIVDLSFSFYDDGFQWGGGADWDQSAGNLAQGTFEVDPGEIRRIEGQIHTAGAEAGDSVTVTADYELWFEGSRDDSRQQSGMRNTIQVEEPNPPEDTDSSDDSTPGFGITSGLASLGAAGYMLKRRLIDDSE